MRGERSDSSPGRGILRRHVLFLLVLLLCASCESEAPSVDQIPIAGGGTVGSLAAQTDTVVLLVYDPQDGFTCSSVLARWMVLKRRQTQAVFLVFTREPTALEQRQLAVYRIKPDRYFATRRWKPSFQTPSEYLFVSGRVVRSQVSVRTTSVLLDSVLANEIDASQTNATLAH